MKPIAQRRRDQAGAATLIVVMVLFFVAALSAAYASRNLIFEQRTSANQYRSTQSLEAAEAGMEWAFAMLNGGRMDPACEPTADTTMGSARQRWIGFDEATGKIRPRYKDGSTNFAAGMLWSVCSLDGGNWTCSCPATGNYAVLPSGSAAFAVRLEPELGRPGLVRVEVNGCNTANGACLTAELTTNDGTICNSTMCSLAMLYPGLKLVPTAAITARGAVNGPALQVYNQDGGSVGITVHAGGVIGSGVNVVTVSGAPPETSLRSNDDALNRLRNDDLCDADANPDPTKAFHCTFSSVFGLQPPIYRDQPAILKVDCNATCTEAEVNAKLARQRSRVVWLSGGGGLTLSNSSATIGSATEPVVLVVEGPVTFEATATASPTDMAHVFGLVYAKAGADIHGGRINGALVSAESVSGNGNGQIVYDAEVLRRLRMLSGSFVRVPGSWRDFP